MIKVDKATYELIQRFCDVSRWPEAAEIQRDIQRHERVIEQSQHRIAELRASLHSLTHTCRSFAAILACLEIHEDVDDQLGCKPAQEQTT